VKAGRATAHFRGIIVAQEQDAQRRARVSIQRIEILHSTII
jgi:hypothetical protein